MITFMTPTVLPIEAATTMGISAKDGEKSIGKFGTGLKYAIAGILRLGGAISIRIDSDEYEFTTTESVIRGQVFRIVNCNNVPCGFTTSLGKHWQPWQIFRELASNALDEGGRWVFGSDAELSGVTLMTVNCREVESAGRDDNVFLDKSKCATLLGSTMGAQVYSGPSQHYYYRGIRAGSFPGVVPVTIDVDSGELSEDRLLDLSVVQSELAWAFRYATEWDDTFFLSVLAQREPSDFWVQNVSAYVLTAGELPADVMSFIKDRPKWIAHPAFRMALDKHTNKGNGARWSEIDLTAQYQRLLNDGEALCSRISVDPIPRDRVHFTRDMSDEQLAITCMDTRDVWFSTKLVMRGRDEFLSGYVEEAVHAMTGFRDCTRDFQNALLSIIVSTCGRSDDAGSVVAQAA